MDRRPPERRAGLVIRLVAPPVRLLATLLARHRSRGARHLPPRGAAIACGNHTGPWDGIAYGLLLEGAGVPPRFLAKDQLFRVPVLGPALRAAGQIPISRGSLRSSGGLDGAEAALAAGQMLMMFPEGTYTRDPAGWPMRARHGAARLALRTGAPLVPMACWGSQELWAPRSRSPRPFPRRTVALSIGAPLLAVRGDDETEAQAAQRVTVELMGRITELLAELRDEAPPPRIHDPRQDDDRPEDA